MKFHVKPIIVKNKYTKHVVGFLGGKILAK